MKDGDLKLILAEELSERLQGKFGKQLEILARFKGSTLEGIKYANPLSKQEPMLDRECPVVIGGDYITTEAGTGLVHTAPGHGHEDYQVIAIPFPVPAIPECLSRCEAGVLRLIS